jgi:hypothetical protein
MLTSNHVDNQQYIQPNRQTKHNIVVFLLRMVRVRLEHRILIEKYRRSLRKSDPVIDRIACGLLSHSKIWSR